MTENRLDSSVIFHVSYEQMPRSSEHQKRSVRFDMTSNLVLSAYRGTGAFFRCFFEGIPTFIIDVIDSFFIGLGFSSSIPSGRSPRSVGRRG